MNELDTSGISLALNEIVDNASNKPDEQWAFEFVLEPDAPIDLEDKDVAVTPEEKTGIYRPHMTTNIDFIGDFEKGFCDHVNAEVVVGAGMWLKVLYPARNQMRVKVRRNYANRQGGSEVLAEPLVYTFKPIFKQNEESHDNIDETSQISRAELDMRGIVTLVIDLLDPSSEAVQSAPCGGLWRNVTSMQVLRAVFADVCAQFTFEGEPLIRYYRVSESFNTEKRPVVTVQAGTMLTDLPKLLQEYHGGLWPTGANRYVRGDTWFFYPPYDTERIDRERKTLTIVRAPERLYTGVPKTWLMDGDQLKIIATGAISIRDNTQDNFLSTGNGRRFASAKSVLDGSWLEVKDNKAVAKRSTNMTEVRIDAPGYTDNRIYNSPRGFTDNTMKELSDLAGKKGNLVSLTWNYADHTLIEPGMPCRILYERDKVLLELKGVVVGIHAAVQTTQYASANGTYTTTCGLFVFCQSPQPAQ